MTVILNKLNLFGILTAALSLSACATDTVGTARRGDPNLLASWVQAAPAGRYSVRAVTKAATCPALMVDGKNVNMGTRGPATPDFPNLVCEADIGAGVKTIQVAGGDLPAPKPKVNRLVVMGDSGCRIKVGVVQDCNDPKDWPLATIAASIKREAPDAVLHVGDYYYREIECPADRPGCKGSPFGDNQASWLADWLVPAAPIFETAPVLLARGNHELCTRGGKGWTHYLAPGPIDPACRKTDAPFIVSIGPEDVALIDSSDAEDLKAIQSKADILVSALNDLKPQFSKPVWFLTHKPIWAISDGDGKLAPVGAPVPSNLTWASALKTAGIPTQLDMVFSGHLHVFQAMTFADNHPGQILTGISGADLHTTPIKVAPGRTVAGATVTQGYGTIRYGYLVLERQGTGWAGALKTPDGAIMATCEIKGRAANCTQASN
jgi:hypothetical protein